MSLKLYALAEVRVLEEDQRLCSHDCEYIDRMNNYDAICQLHGVTVMRGPKGPTKFQPFKRCDECLADARELVAQENEQWLNDDGKGYVVTTVALRRPA
jgi:hypothetical protein